MGRGDPSPHLWRFGQPGDADLAVQPLQPPVDKRDLSTTQRTGKLASRRGEREREAYAFHPLGAAFGRWDGGRRRQDPVAWRRLGRHSSGADEPRPASSGDGRTQ
jgi:hypothetical protein